MKNLKLHKDIKVVEFDPNKQYALIFPDWMGIEEFERGVESLKEIGVHKFVALHSSSGATIEELRKLAK